MDRKQKLSDWIDLYSDRLLRIAFTYVKDRSTAEDRVQDAFIKAYGAMEQLLNVENPFPWLVRIVINECRTGQKRRWREILTSFIPDRVVTNSEELYINRMEKQNLHNAILSLPEMYRIPIVLFHFEECSIQQIGQILQINTETVKARLSRGRQRLKKILNEGEDQCGERIPECT